MAAATPASPTPSKKGRGCGFYILILVLVLVCAPLACGTTVGVVWLKAPETFDQVVLTAPAELQSEIATRSAEWQSYMPTATAFPIVSSPDECDQGVPVVGLQDGLYQCGAYAPTSTPRR